MEFIIRLIWMIIGVLLGLFLGGLFAIIDGDNPDEYDEYEESIEKEMDKEDDEIL